MRLEKDDLNPYARKYRVAKWNIAPDALQEYRILRVLPEFRGWTAADHARRSAELLQLARAAGAQRTATTDYAFRTYGDHGLLVSGVVREHFPECIKDRLRSLWTKECECHEASLAHWRASGRTRKTWPGNAD